MAWSPLKRVLVGCTGVLLFATIVVSIIWFVISTTFNKWEEHAADENRERERIANLNTLSGVVVNDIPYAAPFSKDTAALILLKVGLENSYTSRRGYPSSLKNSPKWVYDYKTMVIPSKNVKLKVGTITYHIDFKQVVYLENTSENMYAHDGGSYETDEYSTLEQSDIEDLKEKAYKEKDPSARTYLENRETLRKLYGFHTWADEYIEKNIFKKEFGYSNIILNELLFKNGDSISIKGKIVDNKIVPLF